jgi:hypothetical protein
MKTIKSENRKKNRRNPGRDLTKGIFLLLLALILLGVDYSLEGKNAEPSVKMTETQYLSHLLSSQVRSF